MASVKYTSVYDAIAFIIKCGRSALLAKFGIKSHIEFCPLIQVFVFCFGMQWRNKIFIYLGLAFRLSQRAGSSRGGGGTLHKFGQGCSVEDIFRLPKK